MDHMGVLIDSNAIGLADCNGFAQLDGQPKYR